MASSVAVGFYGKLPTLGDFVGRRVPEALLASWDGWLQGAIAASRESMGEAWLDLYLTAPMWRFFAQAGALDAQAVAGILFPSVDRVGRCFPFTVFAQLPVDSVGLVVAERCADWFERVEDLVLAQLEEASLGLDGLDEALIALSPRLEAGMAGTPRSHADAQLAPDRAQDVSLLHVPLGDRADVGATALAWFDTMLRKQVPRSIQWWSSGSARVRPSWLITRGLPEPTAFASMLNGAWHDWPWDSCELATVGEGGGMLPRLHLESAGSTHPGNVRSENQDAWLARPDLGLWAVADGMGGHEQGHVASQMARDALASVAPQPTLAQQVLAARGALEEANRYLFSLSVRPVNPLTSGTTVVLMLVREHVGVCLWAGDSRLYRLRDGALEQLTTDHSEAVERAGTAEGASSNVITRAVGGREGLELDQVSFSVQVGDRFLLCSDGLYRELTDTELAQTLQAGDALTTVDALLSQVLRGEAADNVTAIVVDAQPAAD